MASLTASQQFSAARIRSAEKMTYFGSTIYSTIVIECLDIPMGGVDRHGRIYYNPEFVATAPIDDTVTTILHEVLHIGMRHWQRSLAYFGREPLPHEALCWNFAADCTVNPVLRDCRCKMLDTDVFPGLFKLPENLSVEQYYEAIRDQVDRQAKGKCGASRFQGGSAADGVRRPWELPHPDVAQPGEASAPVLTPLVQDMLAKKAAEAINVAKSRGHLPAGLIRFADEILRPTIDPRKELLSLVRAGLSHAAGCVDFTYQRPCRRRQISGVVLPSLRAPVPYVTVIIDTSGSMSSSELALGLGLTAKLLQAMPDRRGVRVLTGDVTAAWAGTIFRPEQITLGGGGGTDMRVLIAQALDERPRPQLVLVFTDACTPWPESDLGVPIVACVTDERQEPPAWIKTVRMVAEQRIAA